MSVSDKICLKSCIDAAYRTFDPINIHLKEKKRRKATKAFVSGSDTKPDKDDSHIKPDDLFSQQQDFKLTFKSVAKHLNRRLNVHRNVSHTFVKYFRI